MIKQLAGAVAAIGLAIGLAACGASPASSPPPVVAKATPAPTETTAPPATPSVRLVWHKFLVDGGDPEADSVARITNPTGSPVADDLDTEVLDATGTIVGSSHDVLPVVPAHAQFDFFTSIGGGVLGVTLTGTPVSVVVHLWAHEDGDANEPMLDTSEMVLTKGQPGDPSNFTNAPETYNLSVRVTNSTTQPLTFGVNQQVVLYDQAGDVVGGGGTVSSDNVPHDLSPELSYRESWTDIPVWQDASRAVYTVWSAS